MKSARYYDEDFHTLTDKEIIAEMAEALKTIRDNLGIKRDFCPLGTALELEPTIRKALKLAGEH